MRLGERSNSKKGEQGGKKGSKTKHFAIKQTTVQQMQKKLPCWVRQTAALNKTEEAKITQGENPCYYYDSHRHDLMDDTLPQGLYTTQKQKQETSEILQHPKGLLKYNFTPILGIFDTPPPPPHLPF